MYILSIDFGTSSVKIAVLNKNIDIITSITKEYQYEVIDNDLVEINLDLVLKRLGEGLKELDNKYLKNIDIIVFDVFSPSLVTLDKNGDCLYPCILHLDRRSREQSRKIINVFGKKNYQNKTGVLPFAGGVSITSLLWIKENLPEVYKNTYKFGHLNTFIYKKLTDKWAIDPVNASMMGLYETIKWGGWSEDICREFDISMNKLPQIINAGTNKAGLVKRTAYELGLQEGTPVVFGSNDAATAILGAGLEEEGDILNIAGSNEIATILTEKPIVNDSYYLRNSLYENKWQMFSINIGGLAIEWIRQIAFNDFKKDYFYNEYLTELVNKYTEYKLKKFTVEFKPYLAGDRHSLKVKRGRFNGMTLDTSREDLLMAILLGINEPIINNLNAAAKHLKLNNQIIITGGLADSSYINIKKKIIKDFNFKFKKRCTTIGNGKLAFWALNN
ncbi:MAG: FGGY-family carbohydrate kinase [bacterium]